MSERTALNYELATARAEESEALRRARRLQITGAAPGDLREAVQQVQACHARATEIARELKEKAKPR